MSTSTQATIEDRQKRLIEDFKTNDLPKFMAWFADDAKISNHASGAIDRTKAQHQDSMEGALNKIFSLEHTSVGTHGTEEFACWENTCKMTILQETPMIPAPAGTVLNTIGVVMTWWNSENKITKWVEYSQVVQ